MSRIWFSLDYVAFLVREVVRGSFRVAVSAFSPRIRSRPSIVEFPSRCRTDVEVTFLTSSITITPGTLVLGVAAAADDLPVTVYVHVLFGGDRAEAIAGLRDMESRLLRALRGRTGQDVRPAKGRTKS